MQIACLRNWDVVLICCTVDQDNITARWVQINPAKLQAILGTQQELKEPKQRDSLIYTVQIPADITAVHTDVRFPLDSVR